MEQLHESQKQNKNLYPTIISEGIAFSPSQYDPDLTMNGTAQSVALATGVLKLKVINRGSTTEAIRFALGTSAANAEGKLNMTTNGAPERAVTGDYLPAAADQGDGKEFYGVSEGMTHYAIANAVDSDTQIVSITQGK